MTEMIWRVVSLSVALAGPAAPPVPAVPPPIPALPVLAPFPAFGPANCAPTPVAAGVDATEVGQLGYHIGTAMGGALLPYLATIGAVPATNWYSFHLSRAQTNGGTFGFATPQRPDIVTFAINLAGLTLHEFVVWENKGHCGNVGLAPLAAALAQAQALVNMTILPGVPGVPGIPGGFVFPAPVLPAAHLASQVDVFFGNFRVQVTDPPSPPSPPIQLGAGDANAFLQAYYSPFMEVLQRRSKSQTYDGRLFETTDLPQRVRLGLDAEVVRAFGSTGLSAAVARATGPGYLNTTPEEIYVDPTGISVELPMGWNPRVTLHAPLQGG